MVIADGGDDCKLVTENVSGGVGVDIAVVMIMTVMMMVDVVVMIVMISNFF